MPKFSRSSLSKLNSCHNSLQEICFEVIQIFDFTVLSGYRNQKKQQEAFENGLTQLQYPFGKHNSYPSKAVDVAPYPIDWEDNDRYILLAGLMCGIAHKMEIDLRWGGDWNGNFDLKDNNFNDYGHFELKN